MYGRAFIGDLLASVNLRFSSGESGMNLYEKEQELAKPTDNNNKIISSFFFPCLQKTKLNVGESFLQIRA